MPLFQLEYGKISGVKLNNVCFESEWEFLKSISSLVTFTDAYVSYVIPKTGYDESTKNYFVTVTVCVVVPKPGIFNFEVETKLNGLNVPAIFKVINILPS